MGTVPQRPVGTTDSTTAKRRRITSYLGSYVVAAVTQRGEDWERIARARQRWGVTPVCQLPPVDPADSVPWQPDWPVSFGLLPPEVDFDTKSTAYPHPWAKVFAALAAYSPPRDALLEYRDRLLSLLGFGAVPATDDEVRPPDLPIRRMQDPITVELWWTTFVTRLHLALSTSLHEAGVELAPYWMAATRDAMSAVQLSPEGSADYGPVSPYIDPTFATKAEVNQALDWLAERGEMPFSSTHVRSPRDPLTCVQCAIWYDEAHWTHKRLGEHFGWTVQYPVEQKPRCETARQHIAEGRRILNQR